MQTTLEKNKTKTYTNPTKNNNFLKVWEKSNNKAEELARWMSLYDAVNLIFDKAEEKGMDIESIELPPIKIKDYMDSVVDIYHRKILSMKGIEIFYSEKED